MANATVLKRRIGSVKNTRQITKAMELVAAAKMRRAQQAALATRPYREEAHNILARLSAVTDVFDHPLFARRSLKTHLIVVITSDTGLAGAYDGNVLKKLTKILLDDQKNNIQHKILSVGKKGGQFISRLEDVDLVASFPGFSTQPKGSDLRSINQTVFDMYKDENVDAVTVIYTQFFSSVRQEVAALGVLPATIETDKKSLSEMEVGIFEPSINSIVESVVERLIEVQLWQAVLESQASEFSMRMMAMKNASDNASEIIDDLTLAFNTARQAAITQEIAEIVGGAEAVSS